MEFAKALKEAEGQIICSNSKGTPPQKGRLSSCRGDAAAGKVSAKPTGKTASANGSGKFEGWYHLGRQAIDSPGEIRIMRAIVIKRLVRQRNFLVPAIKNPGIAMWCFYLP